MKMQSFMCFVIVFAMSSATDVTVYTSRGYYTEALSNENMVVLKPVSCFSFGYHLNDPLYMRLYIRNEPPGVTAITVIYQSGLETVERSKVSVKATDATEKYYWVRGVLNYSEVKISLKLCESNSFSSILVAEGRDVMTSRDKMAEEIYTYNDICLKPLPCVLLVNLEHGYNGPTIHTPLTVHETTTPFTNLENNNNNDVSIVSPWAHEDTRTSTSNSASNTGTPVITINKINTSTEKPVTDSESLSNSGGKSTVPTSAHHENKEQTTNDTNSTNQQPFPPNVFIYVITSIIVMGVIILMIYLCIKKYCHRNSQPVETIELNTYATGNEVVYAELSLKHEDSQPRHADESPYAKIIGVLKPADGQRKINKS